MLNKFEKANWFFYIVLVLFTFCDIYIIHSLSHHYTLQLYSNDGLKKHSIEELRLKIVNFLAPKFGQTLDWVSVGIFGFPLERVLCDFCID